MDAVNAPSKPSARSEVSRPGAYADTAGLVRPKETTVTPIDVARPHGLSQSGMSDSELANPWLAGRTLHWSGWARTEGLVGDMGTQTDGSMTSDTSGVDIPGGVHTAEPGATAREARSGPGWSRRVLLGFLDPEDLAEQGHLTHCSAEEVSEARNLAYGTIADETRKRYSRLIAKWCLFLADRGLEGNPFLDGLSTLVRSTLVITWYKLLKQEGLSHLDGARALKRMFAEYEQDLIADFLDSSKVKGAKKTLATAPRSHSVKKRGGAKLPATPEMWWSALRILDEDCLNGLRKSYPQRTDLHRMKADGSFKCLNDLPLEPIRGKEAADALLCAAACTYEFGVGARISEVGYTGPSKRNKRHALRTREVRFHYKDPTTEERAILFSWQLKTRVVALSDFKDIVMIEFNQDSSKTNQGGQPCDGIWMRDGEHESYESQAMDILIRFALLAGHNPVDTTKVPTEQQIESEDPFFSRYMCFASGKRNSTSYKFRRADSAAVIKRAAEALGIPRECVSTHSWRRGAASVLFGAGLSPSYINRLMGWRTDMSKVYQWLSADHPHVFRVLKDTKLNIHAVGAMIPSTSLPADGRIQIQSVLPPGIWADDEASDSESDQDEAEGTPPLSSMDVFNEATLRLLDRPDATADTSLEIICSTNSDWPKSPEGTRERDMLEMQTHQMNLRSRHKESLPEDK